MLCVVVEVVFDICDVITIAEEGKSTTPSTPLSSLSSRVTPSRVEGCVERCSGHGLLMWLDGSSSTMPGTILSSPSDEDGCEQPCTSIS